MTSTPVVTPVNMLQVKKDSANEIKVTNWLTLKWEDFPSGANKSWEPLKAQESRAEGGAIGER